MTAKFLFDVSQQRTSLPKTWPQRILPGALSALMSLTSLLAGCSTYDTVTQHIAQHLTPYRITIPQGNFVAKETAAQLHVGMSRAQVRDLLGSPLVADMFHKNRWDYVFYIQHGPQAVVQRRTLTVYFDGDRLTRWTDTGNLLSEKQLLDRIDAKGKKKPAKRLRSPNDYPDFI